MLGVHCPCGQLFETDEKAKPPRFVCKSCGQDPLTPELKAQGRGLPRPLLDPLFWGRGLIRRRWFFRFCIGLFLLSMILISFQGFSKDEDDSWVTLFIASIFGAVMLAIGLVPLWVLLVYLLPKKPADALFLRAFRKDADNWPLRKSVIAGLGPTFRPSGIRSPQRRWPAFMRGAWYLLFLIRYCSPRYMSLEAGDDWKARLWRSMSDARCSVLDFTDLTPYLLGELALAHCSMGRERLLLVADEKRIDPNWRANLVTVLGEYDAKSWSKVLLWSSETAKEIAFRTAVAEWAETIPPGTAGMRSASLPLLRGVSPVPEHAQLGGTSAWLQGGLGAAFTLIVPLVYARLRPPQFQWVDSFWLLLTIISSALFFYYLVCYLVDCGSWRRRFWLVLRSDRHALPRRAARSTCRHHDG